MAKAKKKKQFVPLFEDYFDQFNFLSFDQAGRLFALIRGYHSMNPEQFHALEASIALETGAKIIWSFLKSDLDAWYEEKQKKSETNAANARSRWKSAAPSPCSGDIPGQKSIIFTAEQAAPGAEPVLTAHAAGMRNDANGMRNDAIASKNDAVASPIYNINNNSNIHNNNIDISDQNMDSGISNTPTPGTTEALPTLETIIRLFTDNGSTKSEAQKYYNYYRLRDWMTAKGELITDVEESVKRWIDRNARFWSRKSGKGQGRSRSNKNRTPYTYPVNDPVPDSHQPGNSHTSAAPATPYWDGTCASPSIVKPGSFRDFEQRNYDFNALQKMLTGCAM